MLSLEKEEAVGEVFNVGTGSQVSIRQLAEMIKRLTNASSRMMDLPSRTPQEAQPMRSYPSIDKIKSKLNYTPPILLEDGLRRTIRYQKDLFIK